MLFAKQIQLLCQTVKAVAAVNRVVIAPLVTLYALLILVHLNCLVLSALPGGNGVKTILMMYPLLRMETIANEHNLCQPSLFRSSVVF